jgi:hypothetical protein
MRPGAFVFSGNWLPVVRKLPETGMGYTECHADRRSAIRSSLSGFRLSKSRVRGLSDVPFSENDIAEIKATHDEWDWAEKP